MAKLETLAYATPLELLAERFHMDEALITALNPGADFAKAGTTIVVAAPNDGKLASVARIEVEERLAIEGVAIEPDDVLLINRSRFPHMYELAERAVLGEAHQIVVGFGADEIVGIYDQGHLGAPC